MPTNQNGILQKEIAERQRIPLKYLDKIVSELKAANLIVNVAGKRSGYLLARPAHKISVYTIYQAFEGHLALVQCVNDQVPCSRCDFCASQLFWSQLNTEMEAIMVGKSLQSLIDEQIHLNEQALKEVDFQI